MPQISSVSFMVFSIILGNEELSELTNPSLVGSEYQLGSRMLPLVIQSGALEVRDRFVLIHRDTVTGGHVQKESLKGGIIILLTPAPVVDPFSAWKPPHE